MCFFKHNDESEDVEILSSLIHEPPYKLSELQRIFTFLISFLIQHAYRNNMELTFGEAYRDPRIALLNAEAGKGIKKSLHCSRLAVDLNLFIKDKYVTDKLSYRRLGEYWKSFSVPGIECAWGGDFKSINDPYHFSISYCGRK